MSLTRRVLFGGLVAVFPGTAIAGKTRYIYDSLGRVTGALYDDGALSVYGYDPAGNRNASQNPYIGASIDINCFDANYYTRAYPDVTGDPWTHFDNEGWKSGKRYNPNSFFNTKGYLTAYTDVANANINPLLHYVNNGWIERRDPSGLFGTQEYLDSYPDILATGINPLRHYLQYGYAEGRNPGGDGSYRPV